MPTISYDHSPRFLQRAMCFIDGGYLRRGIMKLHGHDFVDYPKLLSTMIHDVSQSENGMRAYLIRTIYYDARVEDQNDPSTKKQLNISITSQKASSLKSSLVRW